MNEGEKKRIPVESYTLFISAIDEISQEHKVSHEEAAKIAIEDAKKVGAHGHIDFIKAALKHLQENKD